MRVPFGDLKHHYQKYKADFDTAVNRVLASGHFILGPELERFEKDFEEYLGAGYVVGCASGTEAIYLALAACNVGPGDEVLVVSHTAVPTVSAISMTGATPVFVDIDPDTCLMDLDVLESRITVKSKAVVPVHLYGQMVDMPRLMQIAERRKLHVIEDCAQSTGARQNGITAGVTGEFGAFSFYPSKNIGAFGDGGGVTTKSRENYDRLKMLRNYGQSKRYYHDTIGINSRLDEMQAAILTCQLPYLEQWNNRRRAIAARYTEQLKGIVQTPEEADSNYHVYHLYVIQTDRRDELQEHMMENGIQTLIHYPIPAHLQTAYNYLGGKPGQLRATERVAKRILSLPMHQGLTDEQVESVIDSVKSFFANNSAIMVPLAPQVMHI